MPRLSRRRFVQTAACSPLIVAAAQAAAAARVPRVDTHLHCFAGNDPRFPYHAQAPYRPETPATPEHLLKCMREAEVDYAIVVHPEPYQDDPRYLEHCLTVGRGQLKGTALVFADRPGSLDKLPDLARRLDLVAVRVHAYAADRLPPFGKPELRRLWQLATDHGLAVQLHFEPRYAPGFEPLIREFTKTRVIIDHLGRPFQGTPQEHDAVVKWSRFPHTILKLSAIPTESTDPQRDVRSVIRQLTDAFGPDRLLHGGGFDADATGASYRAAFERTRSFLDHFTAAEQAQVLGGNAVKLFRVRG